MTRDFTLFGSECTSDDFLSLCIELELLPLFLRRYIERKSSSSFSPDEDQQVEYQRQFLSRENIRSAEDLSLWLSRKDVTEVQLSKQLFHSLQLSLFKSSKFTPQIESLFLDTKSRLDKAMYSLIRCSERSKANELYLRLTEEECSFADLASQYSEGYEQDLNGLIGPHEFARINPSIAERLRISKEGQVWEPFEEQNWWVIIRLEKLIPARLDSEMRSRLIDILYEDWIKEKVLAEIQSISRSPLFNNSSSQLNSPLPDLSERKSMFRTVLNKVWKPG